MEEKKKIIDGEKCAVIWLPADTVGFEVTARIMDKNFNLHKAVCVFTPDMAREAFKDGQEWEDDNARYVVNYDKLEELGIFNNNDNIIKENEDGD